MKGVNYSSYVKSHLNDEPKNKCDWCNNLFKMEKEFKNINKYAKA